MNGAAGICHRERSGDLLHAAREQIPRLPRDDDRVSIRICTT